MRKFKIFWANKSVETLYGDDILDALRYAGYGMEAIRVVEWFEEITA